MDFWIIPLYFIHSQNKFPSNQILCIMIKNTFTLLLGLFAAQSTWAYDFQINGLCYNITDEFNKTAEVTYEKEESDQNYESLKGKVTIPATVNYEGIEYHVTGIDYDAFSQCSTVTEINIPYSVTFLGSGAFEECYALRAISVDTNNTFYSSEDGVLFDKDKITLMQYPCGKTETSYQVPSSVTNIGYQAFLNCSTLKNISLPDNLSFIHIEAFKGCSALTEITIPSNVIYIYLDAFLGCSALTNIFVENDNTAYCSEDGVLFDKDKTTLIQYPCGKIATSYQVPSSVTIIERKAFYNSSKLSDIQLPNNIRNIGAESFKGTALYNNPENWTDHTLYLNNSLIEVNKNHTGKYEINADTKVIADYAFSGCSSITEVTIPDGMRTIGNCAFEKCSSLLQINIPDGVESIGLGAFNNCTALSHINIPNSVTKIGMEAFKNTAIFDNSDNWKDNLFYIDNCLIQAKDYSNSEYCAIAPGTRIIADNAFGSFLFGITQLTIPNSVTHIGNDVFDVGPYLREIFVEAVRPPVVSISTFRNYDFTVYVPSEALETYRNTPIWKEFNDLRPMNISSVQMPSLSESISIYGCSLQNSKNLPITVYDVQGHLVYNGNNSMISLPEGIYIVNCSGTSHKVILRE